MFPCIDPKPDGCDPKPVGLHPNVPLHRPQTRRMRPQTRRISPRCSPASTPNPTDAAPLQQSKTPDSEPFPPTFPQAPIKKANRRRRLGSRTDYSPRRSTQTSPAFYGGECLSNSGCDWMHKYKMHLHFAEGVGIERGSHLSGAMADFIEVRSSLRMAPFISGPSAIVRKTKQPKDDSKRRI